MNINPKSFLRNIQKSDWDCGIAASAFLLENKGHKVNRSKLVRELGASPDRGTDLVKIVRFFKDRYEFNSSAGENQTFKDLQSELKQGRMCMVAYQNWEKPKDVGKPDWGHYGVVYASKGNSLYLFDPGSPTGKMEFSREEFEKRWYETDLGVLYTRWAMSVDLM